MTGLEIYDKCIRASGLGFEARIHFPGLGANDNFLLYKSFLRCYIYYDRYTTTGDATTTNATPDDATTVKEMMSHRKGGEAIDYDQQ